MVEKKTLFQRIMDREEPGDILYEDDRCVALRDINPQTPIHILTVPHKPIPTLDHLTVDDAPLVGHLFLVARKVAAEEGLTGDYRTVLTTVGTRIRRCGTSTCTFSVGAGCPGLRAKDAEGRTDG